MPTPTVATYGGITFVGPFTSANATDYFATSFTDSGATQVLDRWRYVAQHGQRIKRMGLGMRTGAIVGWVDASTAANLQTGKTALDALVASCSPGNLVLAGNTVSDVVITAVTYEATWSHDTRFAVNFMITWERVGGG